MKNAYLHIIILLFVGFYACTEKKKIGPSKVRYIFDDYKDSSNTKIVSTESKKISEETTKSAVDNSFKGIKQFFNRFKKQAQNFLIDADQDEIIIGNEGTKISLKANTLISQKTGKPIQGKVQFSLTEYFSISDILLANLSTQSNGKILETAGMINLEAFSNGSPCELKNGAFIQIQFPTKRSKKEGMRLFSGNWKGDRMDWTPISISEVGVFDEGPKRDTIYLAEFRMVEEMPTFPASNGGINQFIAENTIYPYTAIKEKQEGTVHLKFTINTDGMVSRVRIIKGVSPILDKAARFIAANMPRWNPGRQRGKAVPVAYRLPIKFSLDGVKDSLPEAVIQQAKLFEELIEEVPLVYGDENYSFVDTTYNVSRDKTQKSILDDYLFRSGQLGWINCDRFIDQDPKIDLIVNIKEDAKIDMKLVFEDINSVLAGDFMKFSYRFYGVPLGEKAKLVAIKYENNQYYLCIKSIRISEKIESGLIFQPIDIERLEGKLSALKL